MLIYQNNKNEVDTTWKWYKRWQVNWRMTTEQINMLIQFEMQFNLIKCNIIHHYYNPFISIYKYLIKSYKYWNYLHIYFSHWLLFFHMFSFRILSQLCLVTNRTRVHEWVWWVCNFYCRSEEKKKSLKLFMKK